ncbi:hypothetical protein CROQUDRAFT_92048 [Cronartium quercuum f. sp. fusiforme G11]|uniref:Uncharacterized protein n=1 Tax=Cronartium quercuum f. sp. fusiforme G11 TaxID=708437 RepID=A0A9P6NH73_9BASI|nr:hypothetical protein CROQUDRAFT_92048 [Cronartium quercuum f. sp. fusiforme G11]
MGTDGMQKAWQQWIDPEASIHPLERIPFCCTAAVLSLLSATCGTWIELGSPPDKTDPVSFDGTRKLAVQRRTSPYAPPLTWSPPYTPHPTHPPP